MAVIPKYTIVNLNYTILYKKSIKSIRRKCSSFPAFLRLLLGTIDFVQLRKSIESNDTLTIIDVRDPEDVVSKGIVPKSYNVPANHIVGQQKAFELSNPIFKHYNFSILKFEGKIISKPCLSHLGRGYFF